MKTISSYHVGVSAEAFVAAQFARCDCDVLVQYGANQPEYDLVISRGLKLIKVSVKGSQDGGWGLTQSYLKEANYYQAVDHWLAKHGIAILFCFVQFKGISLSELPRLYLAWPQEVAKRLKESAAGRGETILYEEKVWSNRAYAAGVTEKIPTEWCFSAQKVDEVFSQI
jgi:hypothetical protein